MKNEPSKWLPITVSVVALGVSFLGWYEAHRGRLINEAINRPVLTIDVKSAAYAIPLKENSSKVAKGLEVTFELKNLGKTPATIESVKSEQVFLAKCNPASSIVESFKTLAGKEALPNIPIDLHQSFVFNSECNEKEISFLVQLSILYTDNASKIPYTQDFSKVVSVPTATPSTSP